MRRDGSLTRHRVDAAHALADGALLDDGELPRGARGYVVLLQRNPNLRNVWLGQVISQLVRSPLSSINNKVTWQKSKL